MRHQPTLPIIFAAALSACGVGESDDPDDADASGDASGATLEIGTGFPDYQPLTCGQEAPIIQGLQGGFHVWGGFRATGIDPSSMEIDFRLTQGGVEIASANYSDVAPIEDGVVSYAGVAVILAAELDPDAISGIPATLSVQIIDALGRVAGDSVEIVPVCCSF